MAPALSQQKTLIFSYIVDIAILVIFAAIGVALNFASPTRRLFSIIDASIAYPNYPDTVSVPVVFIVAVVAPAAVVCLVALVFVRPVGVDKTPGHTWRRKLWESFAGLLGLAFSVILAFFLSQALKNLFGKPRPDFLARCNPNITNYNQFIDGGFNSEGLEGSSLVFGSNLCRSAHGTPAEQAALDDGYRSFPSGHCIISFAGLAYLSLFLAAKFAASVPYLLSTPTAHGDYSAGQSIERARNNAAAPPLYLFLLAFVPTAGAIYIAATRFSDYKHHGFDVLVSSLAGIACAWLAFRWYHMPIRRGGGWAWTARANRLAFSAHFGLGSFRELEITPTSGPAHATPAQDIELGFLAPQRTLNSSSSDAPLTR